MLGVNKKCNFDFKILNSNTKECSASYSDFGDFACFLDGIFPKMKNSPYLKIHSVVRAKISLCSPLSYKARDL